MDNLINMGSIILVFFILLLGMIFLVNLINKKIIKSLKFLLIAIVIYFAGALFVFGGIHYSSGENSQLIKSVSGNEILIGIYPFLQNNQYVKKDIEVAGESQFGLGPGGWNPKTISSLDGDNQGGDLGDCGAGGGGGE